MYVCMILCLCTYIYMYVYIQYIYIYMIIYIYIYISIQHIYIYMIICLYIYMFFKGTLCGVGLRGNYKEAPMLGMDRIPSHHAMKPWWKRKRLLVFACICVQEFPNGGAKWISSIHSTTLWWTSILPGGCSSTMLTRSRENSKPFFGLYVHVFSTESICNAFMHA